VALGALKNFRHSRSEWSALVDTTFGDLVKERPSHTFFESLYERFAKAQAWRIYPDVLPTFSALSRRGVKMGIISNWDERLRPLLSNLGLDKYFQMIVISYEAGHPKPDPMIFNEASLRLRIPSQSILHVGDNLEMDFLGAQAAGFQALHLCRKGKSSTPAQISSLNEACKRVKAR
jgi:putative hydrolase of the HAD superfamily